MGVISVLVAAIAGFAMGAVWYMSLSKPWIRAAGIPVDETGKPQGNGSPMPFVVSGVAMILVAGMMRHIFAMSGIESAGGGLVAGLGVGLFFIVPWVAMNYAYANRPAMLTLLDGGYAVLGCGVIGLVLGLF
ncbi:hypothetical protein GCM10011360_37310 [Primorskyibacter flagellatus]|uniref:DUF1761 domain-containing protein n=1 Tax=Primorskyibacter flagellatus TaxID=1387277 RepID=A0A917AED6_9RHOB|nr:DUF1761 domain-containing protein [Primorskyibacter flagellatus]GGE46582.1 hypothetical protein GCM10011360_37310 [Primorskyibacter flagellatus]